MKNDWYHCSIRTAQKIKHKNNTNLLFPTPFKAILLKNAENHGIELPWIYGLIRQESRFKYQIRSPAGAKGLMQIMPATGREIAKRLGLSRYRMQKLQKLETNIKIGTFYMKFLIEKFNHPVLATAAYNAGPGLSLIHI